MTTFKKGQRKIAGRQKGTPNRITSTFREAVLLTFEDLGGHEALTKWAAKNQGDFYKIATRLVPVEKAAPPSEGITVHICGPNPSNHCELIPDISFAGPGLPAPHDASGNIDEWKATISP